MRPSLLIACALLASAQSGPSPSLSASELLESGTLEQRTAELLRIIQSHKVSTTIWRLTALSLVEVSDTLGSIQERLAAVSDRLDVVSSSQLRLEETQRDMASRLESLEDSHAEGHGRLNQLQDSNETLPRAARPVNALQNSSSDATDPVSEPQAEMASEQGDASERQPPAASTSDSAAVHSTSRIVLGQKCGGDADCAPLQPQTECGSRGVCVCRPGFRQVSDSACRRRSGLSEPCSEDADCKTVDTICSDGVCSCYTGFWNYNNESCRRFSLANEDGQCLDDRDCFDGLECTLGVCKCRAAIHGQYEFRVANGPSCAECRAELRLTGGDWSFVCDDSWGRTDASVFCRSLGFKSGEAFSNSKYGGGTNMVMDEVACSGSEPHLLRCVYQGWGNHNCDSNEVAAVACSH